MNKELLNKFSIGDDVSVVARVVGIHHNPLKEVTYTLQIMLNDGTEDRVYEVPEASLSTVF